MPSKFAFLSVLTAISFSSISHCLPQQVVDLAQGPQCFTEDALKGVEADLTPTLGEDRYEEYLIEHQDLKLRFGRNRRGDEDSIDCRVGLELLNKKVLGYTSRPDPASLRAKSPTEVIPTDFCGLIWPPSEGRRIPPLQFFVGNQRGNQAFTVDVAIKAIQGYQQWMINRPSTIMKTPQIVIQKRDGEWVGVMGFNKNPNYPAIQEQGTPKECQQGEGCEQFIAN